MSSQLVVVALTACVGAQASGFLKPAYGAHDGLYGAYDTATINRHGEVLHRCPNAVGQTSGCHNIAGIAKRPFRMPAGGGANGFSLAECQKEMHDLHGDTINYDPSVGRCDVKQCGSSDMKYDVHPYTKYMKILSYEVHSTFCMDSNPIISEMSKSAEKAHKSKKAEVKAQIAVVKSVARAGPNPIIALLMSFFNIIVCVALSYWAYKRHQDMKTEGKETKIGMWSMICCVTWTCCGGLGTPVGLCYPMDEDDSKATKAEEEAEAEAAAKAQEKLVKAEADAAAEVKAEADAAAKVEAEAAAKVKAEAAAKAAKDEAEAAAKANRKAEADAAAKVKAEAAAAAKVKAEADAAAKVVKAEADAAAKVKAEATKKAEDAKKAEEATEKATKAEEDA